MKIGFIGLGRMGRAMVRRIIKGRHTVIVYNRTPAKVRDIMKKGAKGAFSIRELTESLPSPRIMARVVSMANM